MSERTTVKQAAIISFRILGVYIFLRSVAQFAYWIAEPSLAIAAALIMTSALAVSIIMWQFAPILPDRLLKLDEHDFDSAKIAAVALRVIGLYMILSGIPATINQAALVAGSNRPAVVIFPALFVVSGFLVWRSGEALSALLAQGLRVTEGSPVNIVINRDFKAMSLAVAGVFILAGAIPSLVGIGTIHYLYPSDDFMVLYQLPLSIAGLIMGMTLILGVRSFFRKALRCPDDASNLRGEDT